MSFGDDLRDAMTRAGISNKEIAEKFGVTSQAVSAWKRGANLPASDKLIAVREYLQQRVGGADAWVEEPDLPTQHPVPAAPAYLPVATLDIRAGAGGGGIIDDAYLGAPRYFEEGFITRELRARPEDLCVVEVEGQSMEPLLRSGDTVLVDLRKKNVAMEGIFVLFDGDGVVCKWVQRVHGSDPAMLRLASENSRFPPYEVEAERCRMLGRVVWFSRRL